jgi:ParB family transcriptional regulator, chromosome partitioning protein
MDNSQTLGRGLSGLIPKKDDIKNETRSPVSAASYLPKTNSGIANQIIHIAPASIEINPYQPRQKFDEAALESLKNSIKEHGIIQPLVVTQTMGGKYELVAGERRLRSSRELNLKTVPVIVRTAKDLEKLELSLIENIQREDLNPIEKAESFKQLIDNFHLTQEEASKRLGIPRSTLNNILRLLQLPTDIQMALASGKISEGQAKLMLSVDKKEDQEKIFKKAAESHMTVKDTEREVKRVKVKTHTREVKKDPRIDSFEKELQQSLGTKVKIRKRGSQGGVVEIEYYSDEELRGIINNISK